MIRLKRTTAGLVLLCLILGVLAPRLSARSLTASQARQIALEFNRTNLAAREDVRSARADVTTARAGAFPDITLTGTYNRNFSVPSFFVSATDDEGVTETIEFKTGFKNSYGANLSIRQSIWQGGKVFTALSIAKDYARYAGEISSQVERSVAYESDVNFYAVALQKARLELLQKSYEAADLNLEVVQKQFSQGQLSEYEVLRARVEKSNYEPQLIQARSDLKLAEKRLLSFLGLDLSEELSIVEEAVSATPAPLPSLEELTLVALERRPEMRQAELQKDMRRKAIRIARGDYFPSLSAVAAYDWQAGSDEFTLSENVSKSWTAGLVLTIPIFRGGATRAAVTQAVVDNNKAALALQQTKDDIRLQVEESYDRFKQAQEALEIQKSTIAQAEEGLRIANLRYQSGVGILLEVLSAQAALTQARQIQAEATFSYRVAWAGLKLATTIDLDS